MKNRKHATIKIAGILCVLLFCGVGVLMAAGGALERDPSKEDKCPVCGMFVYKYPDWIAGIIFQDGHTAFFDGAKDMFKYYFNMDKYAPKRSRKQISGMYVTEYYDMRNIDAGAAFYVVGSDVYGPMGRELIPLASRKDAEIFKSDHSGRLILTFDQVNPAVIRKLDD